MKFSEPDLYLLMGLLSNQSNHPIHTFFGERTSRVSEENEQLQRLMNEEAWKPFDINHEFLLRVTLLKLWQESHILIITRHALVSDACLVNKYELSNLYQIYFNSKIRSTSFSNRY